MPRDLVKPSQLCPSTVNPGLQLHLNDPGLFLQTLPVILQLWVFWAHSSISERKSSRFIIIGCVLLLEVKVSFLSETSHYVTSQTKGKIWAICFIIDFMPLNPIPQVYHSLLVLSIQVPLFKQGLLTQPLISTKNEVKRKFPVVFKPLYKLVITKNILRCLLSSNGKM